MRPKTGFLLVYGLLAFCATAHAQEQGKRALAVFNFQLTTDAPDWVWLEKFLSDQITTDLSRSKALSLVARDDMQSLAQQFKWAPEMATGEAADRIKKTLKIEYLVSGTAAVKDDQVEITGQIVNVAERKELFRKTVRGKTDVVLSLQKQLSAELLGWLTKRPAGDILPELPVWTKSLPAARALYVGMDLFDQGRYAEAWVSFRQARREDNEYIEAAYWVGKTYYFLNRPRHARLAMAPFLQTDYPHPRANDALWEYAQTFMVDGSDVETQLKATLDVAARYDRIASREGWGGDRASRLHYAAARMLAGLGRYEEVLELTKTHDFDQRIASSAQELAHQCFTIQCAMTGRSVPLPPDRRDPDKDWLEDYVFDPAKPDIRLRALRLDRPSDDHGEPTGEGTAEDAVRLMAPHGYVFRSLRFHIAAGELPKETLKITLLRPEGGAFVQGDAFVVRDVSLAEARSQGVLFNALPSTAFLGLKWFYHADARNVPKDESWRIRFRVVAELEKLPSVGAICVTCRTTNDFAVDLDGVYQRSFAGYIGPLKPGRHTLTMRPTYPQAPLQPWKTEVTVEAGQTASVDGQLPVDPKRPASAWKPICLGSGYRTGAPRIEDVRVLPTERGIYLVWGGDNAIWSSASTDGESFSRPTRIPLPISSAAGEERPHLAMAEDGRFILLFCSRRSGEGHFYTSWSYDFQRWSAPVRTQGVPLWAAWMKALLADDRGRLVVAQVLRGPFDEKAWVDVRTSRDAVNFVSASKFLLPPMRNYTGEPALVQRDDGRYELFIADGAAPAPETGGGMPKSYELLRYTSSDLATWDGPELLMQVREAPRVSAAHAKGRTTIALWGQEEVGQRYRPILLSEQADGSYRRSDELDGLVAGKAVVAWHPKWGGTIVWTLWNKPLVPPGGPYLLRGPMLEQLAGSAGPRVIASREIKGRQSWEDRKVETPGPLKPGQCRPVGEFATSTPDWNERPRWFDWTVYDTHDLKHFVRPAGNAGIQHAEAWVINLGGDGRKGITAAVDADDAKAESLDRVRVDLTAKGDFRNAPVATLKPLGRGRFRFDEPVTVDAGGKALPVRMVGNYADYSGMKQKVVIVGRESDGPVVRDFDLALGWRLDAAIQFGGQVRPAEFVDYDSDFRFATGPERFTSDEGLLLWRPRDWFQVDFGIGRWPHWFFFPAGQPIGVDGALYDVKVSEDLKSVEATPYKGRTGALHIKHPFWWAQLVSEDRTVSIKGDEKPVPVPPGRYLVRDYTEFVVEPSGLWHLLQLLDDQHGAEHKLTVTVEEGKTMELSVGSPMTATLVVEQKNEELGIELVHRDVGGRPVANVIMHHDHASHIGKRAFGTVDPTELTVEILDAQGKSVTKMPMDFNRYGWDPHVKQTTAHWKPPPGLKGRFTALLRYRNPVFKDIKIVQPPEFELK